MAQYRAAVTSETVFGSIVQRAPDGTYSTLVVQPGQVVDLLNDPKSPLLVPVKATKKAAAAPVPQSPIPSAAPAAAPQE